ncbi:MAG: DAK2 domain-containing protein [Lachnospiraceae bacterium]|nr:DAK2 domain-containing protein [Lachnospiraceae bacterium]
MFIAGTHALNENKAWINELNVFPVPDGDTGTNMTMTIVSAAKEVLQQEDDTMQSIVKAISSGSLRGARGNSGVILSQLFRGFSKEAAKYDELGIPELSECFHQAVDKAYKAVMKPKEGTILTVARAIADKAQEISGMEDLGAFMRIVIDCGNETLKKTPEMLPVLKEAGVVDSGGQGLMVVLEGFYEAYLGKEVEMVLPESGSQKQEVTVDVSNIETADIKFGYCTEYIINLEKPFPAEEERAYKAFLESIGDSIVCVADDDFVKTHVHTNDPGMALQRALTYGSLSKIKIDNMREEHNERLIKNAPGSSITPKAPEPQIMPHKAVGFVSVAAGEGLSQIFKDLGVDYVIEGGQTMNPSTDDILKAVNIVNADTVYVLPNNKNIVLAANQAAKMTEDKKLVVIPTATVCQGISCLVTYMADASEEENVAAMNEARSLVKTIEVTYAVRDTVIDGVEIHKNDYMALSDKGILADGKDLNAVIHEAVEKCVDEDSSIVSIYYGSDMNDEDAEALKESLSDVLADAEVEVNYGGQPVYYYIISVE